MVMPGSSNLFAMSDTVIWTEEDERYMQRALTLAAQAAAAGEIPVGAVVISEGHIIGEGWNQPISTTDSTAHAEIIALRDAAGFERNYRLPEATMYVTLEPCVMCAGALVNARVRKLIFAARDIRFGAVRSVFKLADSELLNHQVDVKEGLLAVEAAKLLMDFFRQRR